MLMGGGGIECPPTRARVGGPFISLPPPALCRRTDAEAYKECLDAYLGGLIAEGRGPAREAAAASPSFASEAGVKPLSAAGDALCR